ncbi:unnamed protein product, partial [Polarella glacialis]
PQLEVLDDLPTCPTNEEGRASADEINLIEEAEVQSTESPRSRFLDLYVESELDLYLDLYLSPETSGSDGGDVVAAQVEALRLRLESAETSVAQLFPGEPGEEELIQERVKLARHSLPGQGLSMAALPAESTPLAAGRGFDFHMASRGRQGQSRDALKEELQGASDLTRGASLAGNPLAALRHRRGGDAALASEMVITDLGIRELLRRNQV